MPASPPGQSAQLAAVIALAAALSASLSAALASPSPAPGLTIALVPEQNVFRQAERYDRLFAWIEKRTGLRLRATTISTYAATLDELRAGRVSGAFLGSYAAAMALQSTTVEPVARPMDREGRTSYRGLVFVRSDSRIRGVEDMRGSAVAFVDQTTTAGWLFPMSLLRGHGVERAEGFFREVFWAGSHDAAVRAVRAGRADVGCAKDTVFDRIMRDEPGAGARLRVLERSEAVPEITLLLRGEEGPTVRQVLAEALLSMHGDPGGRQVLEASGWLRFVPASRDDYAAVGRMAAGAGAPLQREVRP